MNPELHNAIRRRLDRDFHFKEHGKWLQDGECPECGKKTLYTPADGPWVIRCNRINHCGYERHIKELYDDLFNTWSERHPKTPENPNAAADAYLRDARGLDLAKIAGWYTQESYWDSTLKIGSATVRFPLLGIGYFERIIDQPHRFGHRKATIHGSYKGQWWVPPGLVLHSAERIFITEGIFDAMALVQAGYAAVSALSSNHYPDQALQALAAQCAGTGRPELVWALDSDKAGKKYTLEWVKPSFRTPSR
ncbi:toprim domain-containing protein [Methylomagnum ishizawai]|uniref:toprim domain-containing protein n=1 Tax=Methylomagnum ishizawai TaxID=1760988 RepID=UPI000A166892|nr:toprim domain-containing protein [Methylomagnum ishizawai]